VLAGAEPIEFAYARDMVIIFERLRDWSEVQTLESSDFNDIVLKTPLLCLKRDYVVDVLEQACDGICLCTVRVRYVPKDICRRQAIPLNCQSKAHVGRVESREMARCRQLLLLVHFWSTELRPMRSPASRILASRSTFRTHAFTVSCK
jgi:hypothetical protein